MGELPFWVFLAPIRWRRWVGTDFRVCSDLDQNRAVLWSKSEMKHLKHPKHLKHLKHFLWMFGLLFCQHFKELGGKVKDSVHRRQDQKGMLLVLGWIVAIAPIDSIGRMNGIVAEGGGFIMCSYPTICLINKRGSDLWYGLL